MLEEKYQHQCPLAAADVVVVVEEEESIEKNKNKKIDYIKDDGYYVKS